LAGKLADQHAFIRRSGRASPRPSLTHSFTPSQLRRTTNLPTNRLSPLSICQVAYMSPRLDVRSPSRSLRDDACRYFATLSRTIWSAALGALDRHRRATRSGWMRISVRRGNISQDGFDKLEGACSRSSSRRFVKRCSIPTVYGSRIRRTNPHSYTTERELANITCSNVDRLKRVDIILLFDINHQLDLNLYLYSRPVKPVPPRFPNDVTSFAGVISCENKLSLN
jgi:hypothetical protein